MSRRAAALALLALAAALVALLAWPNPPRGGAAVAPAAGEPVASDGGPADAQAMPLHLQPPSARAQVPSAAAQGPPPMSAESSSAGQGDGAAVEVRVVERDGGAPVPGAQLRWLCYGPEARLHLQRDLARIDAVLAQRGQRALADGEGRARVRWEPWTALVLAGSAPGLWGMAAWEPGHADPTLALAPDAGVAVEVVDAAGRPVAGVPVALRWRSEGRSGDVAQARTDAAGRAFVAHVPHEAAALRERDPTWAVAADILARECVEAPLDLAHLPQQPVRLVLPPTGSLELRVRDPEGEPLDPALATLATLTRPAPHTGARRETLEVTLEVAEGRALLEHVGLDLELQVLAGSLRTGETSFATCPGPTFTGERTLCELIVGGRQPRVRLTLVDPGGEPLADALVMAEIAIRPNGGFRAWVRTDATGVLDMVVGEPEDGPPGELRLSLQIQRSAEGVLLETEIDLPPLKPGVHDLGVVRMRQRR